MGGSTQDERCDLISAVKNLDLSSYDFSNSARLEIKLNEIKEKCLSETIVDCSSTQNAKMRVDLVLKKLLVTMLCFPAVSSLLGVGNNASSIFSSLGNAISFIKDGDESKGNGEEGTGKEEGSTDCDDPFLRLLVRALDFTRNAELVLMQKGSDTSLDDDRAILIGDLIRVRSSSIIPIIITVEDHYAFCLSVVSCHLLCVRELSDDITAAVEVNASKLLTELGEALSASRNGLQVEEALVSVRAAAGHFFSWLREHESALTRECRSAEIIACVNPSVRA